MIKRPEIKAQYDKEVVNRTSTSAEALNKPGVITIAEIQSELQMWFTSGRTDVSRAIDLAGYKKQKYVKSAYVTVVVGVRTAQFEILGTKDSRMPAKVVGVDKDASCVDLQTSLPSFLQYGIVSPRALLFREDLSLAPRQAVGRSAGVPTTAPDDSPSATALEPHTPHSPPAVFISSDSEDSDSKYTTRKATKRSRT
jgi:hypothetical protein